MNNLKIEDLVNLKTNILLDDVFINLNEEKLFHLINHIKLSNLKILLTSDLKPNQYQYNIEDLSSRIKSFYFTQIYKPDDYLIMNLIIKLFNDRQIKIKNDDIISYIVTRVDRSFDNVYDVVNKIDKYSLSHSREITIPLIKKII